jgi:GH15 family glucan-1,4-alpha-glucosidase
VVPAKTRQFYHPDTNVLITRFFAEDGVGEIQDFMPVGGQEAQRHRLIRRVLCVRGSMPFLAQVPPRFDYGMQPHTITEIEAGVVFAASGSAVGLTATVPFEHDGRDVTAGFKLAEGESAVFALGEAGSDAVPRPWSGEEAVELMAATVAFWRNWLPASRYRGRWREVVHRSALTLKLLTYAPTGAIVAAPTTSLPEQIGGERNWDYRYVWIRGELMDSVYLYDRWHRPISSAHWDTITTRADWLCDHWDQPDEGIWETRGGPRRFLYSQLMCWVAFERAIRLALRRGLPADLDRWRRARDAIYRRIMDRGWSPQLKAFAQYEGGDVLDASVLLMPLVGALARAGRLEEARLAFEKMLTYANHLGLYAEQISRTGEQQGNFPQVLTHLALISAAFNLDRALDGPAAAADGRR